MRASNRLGLIRIFLVTPLLLATCDGGGGSGTPAVRDIGGTWTFPCGEYGGEWRSETLQFDESSGIVTHVGLRHATPDCSDQGVTAVAQQGTYTLGQTFDCPSGDENRCTEFDISWESGRNNYGVYSVFDRADPDRLLLSDAASDPVQRPSDVDPQIELRRISFPGKYGYAILDLYLVDGGYDGTPPQPASGYELLPFDLNHGSGGNYIWLYYRMGRANGADGTPLGEIYTVDAFDGESPYKGGTQLPVNLNAGPIVGHELWLYKIVATDTVMRCIVAANPPDGPTIYGPAVAEGLYPLVWVEELLPDSIKSPYPEYPPDVQDLNEGEGFWTEYVYIGYCAD